MGKQERHDDDNFAELGGYLRRLIAPGLLRDVHVLELAGNDPPWQSTGVKLAVGQGYTLFAAGRIQWSARYTQLYGGPRFHLWARIHPGGRTVNLSADSGTFVADSDGVLELGIYMGMWSDDFGALVSGAEAYSALSGHLAVAVVTYDKNPATALKRISANPDAPAVIALEHKRLREAYQPPAGWGYLRECGFSTVYTAEQAPEGRCIHARAEDDQGILRRRVDFPLERATLLNWRWRVDEHPSTEAEDRAMFHDYISLAAEFDNGLDLTWIWSSCLPVGRHFPCPVKVWRQRETHYVIRGAGDSLGEWKVESRSVHADVTEAIGPPPRRITAIWLIALSTFQHGVAQASFCDITLTSGSRRLRVL